MESVVVGVSYLVFYVTLLQIATDNLRQFFYNKLDKGLLESASGLLLQNATVSLQHALVITNCDVYYKMHQFIRSNLFDILSRIDSNVLILSPNGIVEVLLHGDSKYDVN